MKAIFTLCFVVLNIGIAFNQTKPDQGLIGYYPFNGNVNDESGNGYHGNINGATLGEDNFGNPNSAYYFDGIDDYIEIPSNNDFSILGKNGTSWSYCFFFKYDNPPNHDYETTFLSNYNEGSRDDQQFSILSQQLNSGGIRSDIRSSTITHSTNTTTNYYDDQFHHLAWVANHESGKIYLYIDGNLIDAEDYNSSSDYSDIGPIRIACHNWNGLAGFFSGVLDEVRLYNRALTSIEIKDLSNSVDNQIIAHWKFNEEVGNTLNDFSGNGHHGTIFDGIWGNDNLCFNGTASKADVLSSPDFSGMEQLTVKTRFKVSILPNEGEYARIVALWDQFNGFNSNTEQTFTLSLLQNSGQTMLGFWVRMDASTGYNGHAATIQYESFPLNEWLNVISIFDNGKIQLYVNGELVSEEIPNPGASLNTADSPVTIGYSIGTNNNNDNLNTYFDGCIDDIKIINGIELPTSVIENYITKKIVLDQNYPNPFSSTTTIHYSVNTPSNISIKLYDQFGREIRTLVNNHQNNGDYSVVVNCINLKNSIYYYRLLSGNSMSTKKMIVQQ